MKLVRIGLILALAAPIWSNVIYTNLGPSDAFLSSQHEVSSKRFVAKRFVPTASGILSSIRLPVGIDLNTSGGTRPDLLITLRAPGTSPNGAVLDSWVLTAAALTANPAIKVLKSPSHPHLTAGTSYWLRLESTMRSYQGVYDWSRNSKGDTGVSTSSDQGSSWSNADSTSPALEVNAEPDAAPNSGAGGNSAVSANPDADFQVRYFSDLNVADSLINIFNTGANGNSLFGPGLGPAGNICVNVYAFAPDEQMVSCCSCLVTPNGLVSLSVRNDLRSNTLTGVAPNSMVVKLVATATGAGPIFTGSTCRGTAAAAGTPMFPTVLPGSSAAWATTAHVLGGTAVPGAATPFTITETPFALATLSEGERASLVNRCLFIIGNGSGFGICGSCAAGGRGAPAL